MNRKQLEDAIVKFSMNLNTMTRTLENYTESILMLSNMVTEQKKRINAFQSEMDKRSGVTIDKFQEVKNHLINLENTTADHADAITDIVKGNTLFEESTKRGFNMLAEFLDVEVETKPRTVKLKKKTSKKK